MKGLSNNKTEYLSARCTRKEKNQIEEHIKKSGKTKSQYIVDCCIAAKERKTDVLRKYLISKILLYEKINKITLDIEKFSSTNDSLEKVKEEIRELGRIM